MENDFEDFISNRINNNYQSLRQTQKWKNYSSNYQKYYDLLFNQLTLEQKKIFDKVIEFQNAMTYSESCFAYKLAWNDVIKLFKM